MVPNIPVLAGNGAGAGAGAKIKKKGEPKPEPQLNDFGSATLPKSIDDHCWYVRRRTGNCPFVITWTEFSTDTSNGALRIFF